MNRKRQLPFSRHVPALYLEHLHPVSLQSDFTLADTSAQQRLHCPAQTEDGLLRLVVQDKEILPSLLFPQDELHGFRGLDELTEGLRRAEIVEKNCSDHAEQQIR